jgi:hypothetical protein
MVAGDSFLGSKSSYQPGCAFLFIMADQRGFCFQAKRKRLPGSVLQRASGGTPDSEGVVGLGGIEKACDSYWKKFHAGKTNASTIDPGGPGNGKAPTVEPDAISRGCCQMGHTLYAAAPWGP